MHGFSGSPAAPVQLREPSSGKELALGSQGAPEGPLPAATPHSSSRVRMVVRELLSLARPTERMGRRFLAALLVADLAFIAVFVMYAFAEHYGIRDSLFRGNVKFSFVDGGYPEIYGYAKEALLTMFFVAAFARSRQAVYLALALLFAICALDDSMALHEAMGRYLAATTGVPDSSGELVGWSLLGSIPMLAIAAAYRRSDPTSRRHAEAVLLAFAILLFFAIGMDVVHALVQRYVSGFQTVLTILEDGGELLTLTLLCMMSLAIVRFSAHPSQNRAPGASLSPPSAKQVEQPTHQL